MTDNLAERPFKVFHEISLREIVEAGLGSLCRVRWHDRRIGGHVTSSSLRTGLLAMSILVLAACQTTGEQACAGSGMNSPESADCRAAQSDAWSQRALMEAQSGFDRRSPRDR